VGRGEDLGLVEQHELIGFGAEQHDAGLAENMAAMNEAVFLGVPLDMALGVGQHLQRLADDRPAFVTRNMRKRVALRGREGDGGRDHLLHRHGECSRVQ
jgi:hypothetical protein